MWVCVCIHLSSPSQVWRCENCRRPGGQTEVDVDLLQPVHSDAFTRYRENALRKLVGWLDR